MNKLLWISPVLVLLFFASTNWQQKSNTLEVKKPERLLDMASLNSNNNSWAETQGIRFEILLPEQPIYIPKPGEEITIQLKGRITNTTSVPHRFDLQLFLPELLDSKGNLFKGSVNQNTTTEVKDVDIPLIMPGKTLDFSIDTKLGWYNKNCLVFSGKAFYGGVWAFTYLKRGDYKIRFAYENLLERREVLLAKKNTPIRKTEIRQLWVGKATTSFAKLKLD